jgi:hypothetical protein
MFSVLIWDVLFFFFVDHSTFAAELSLVALLLIPFCGLLIMAYFSVWKSQKTAAAIGGGVLAAASLTIGIAWLVGHIHAMLYPVHVIGIE